MILLDVTKNEWKPDYVVVVIFALATKKIVVSSAPKMSSGPSFRQVDTKEQNCLDKDQALTYFSWTLVIWLRQKVPQKMR